MACLHPSGGMPARATGLNDNLVMPLASTAALCACTECLDAAADAAAAAAPCALRAACARQRMAHELRPRTHLDGAPCDFRATCDGRRVRIEVSSRLGTQQMDGHTARTLVP